MRIKMIHEISGLIDGKYWPARGGVIDVNDDEAQRLIDIGGAEIADESDVETGEATEGETDEVESAAVDESDVETAAIAAEPKKRTARKV